MKIENTYYICDRCGENIGKEIPSERRGILSKWIKRLNMQNMADVEFISENIVGYVSNAYLLNHPTANAEIVESSEQKTKHYHLCGKCRKDFEKFMKNN